MIILKILVNLITFTGLLWAFLLHLSNRQSQSYTIAIGYVVCFISLTMDFVDTKEISGMNFLHLSLWLLAYGEIARFYNKEKGIARFLEFRSSADIKSYSFADFHRMALNELVVKSGGRKILKTEDDGTSIKLEVEYAEETEFLIEGKDYDFSMNLIEGFIYVEDKDKIHSLLNYGDVQLFKMKHPVKIVVKSPSTVVLHLIKR